MRAFAVLAAMLLCAFTSTRAAEGQWLKDPQSGCAVFDANTHSSDGGKLVRRLRRGSGFRRSDRDFHNGRCDGRNLQRKFCQKDWLRMVMSVANWGEGWSYDGEEVNGTFAGKGILINDKKDRFEGTWSGGKLNGFGVVVRADGERYARQLER